MDALSALHNRVSVNILEEPAPTESQVNDIVRAGLRACDHRNLRPWSYLLIEGEARHAFGTLMADVMEKQRGTPLEPEFRRKIQCKPLRAPSIIVVAADIKEHDKVPEAEQIMSAAASAQMMMVAAHALGVGAIWRSGSIMFEHAMLEGLGLGANHRLIGFLYLGKPVVTKLVPELDPDDFIKRWPS
ncbi:MAG: nitroreductase family protein [Arenicella sp.]|jgi:nitroreductase|nr:nitroreductase family protein [Arenicella sp.]